MGVAWKYEYHSGKLLCLSSVLAVTVGWPVGCGGFAYHCFFFSETLFTHFGDIALFHDSAIWLLTRHTVIAKSEGLDDDRHNCNNGTEQQLRSYVNKNTLIIIG